MSTEQQDAPTESDVRAAVSAIVRKYARKRPARRGPDRILHCTASNAERELHGRHGSTPKHDGKVIYPDRAAADAAGRELTALLGQPMRSYQCERSNNGHQHLRTVRAGAAS